MSQFCHIGRYGFPIVPTPIIGFKSLHNFRGTWVSSVKVFDLGKAGATKSRISLYMGAAQTLSKIARFYLCHQFH